MSKKIFFLALIVFICDQITKSVVSAYLEINQSIVVIKDIFNIKYINNSGASWGILSGNRILIIFFSLLALIILLRYMNSFKKNTRNNLGFGFLIGGILGNLSDRVFFGYVKDFLAFNVLGYDFPIFNLADSFIVLGVIFLIISVVKGEDRNGSNSKIM